MLPLLACCQWQRRQRQLCVAHTPCHRTHAVIADVRSVGPECSSPLLSQSHTPLARCPHGLHMLAPTRPGARTHPSALAAAAQAPSLQGAAGRAVPVYCLYCRSSSPRAWSARWVGGWVMTACTSHPQPQPVFPPPPLVATGSCRGACKPPASLPVTHIMHRKSPCMRCVTAMGGPVQGPGRCRGWVGAWLVLLLVPHDTTPPKLRNPPPPRSLSSTWAP